MGLSHVAIPYMKGVLMITHKNFGHFHLFISLVKAFVRIVSIGVTLVSLITLKQSLQLPLF